MGHIFKPVIVKPVPAGAEVLERNGERLARWRSKRGKLVTAPLRETSRGLCVVTEGSYYMARFKDGHGVTRTTSTGCGDYSAALSVLGEHVRRAELVRSGVLTSTEDAAADHKRTDISSHLDDYVRSLQAKGDGERHCRNVRRLVETVLNECSIRTLSDVKREKVERWLTRGANLKRSARTRNTYLNACKWFLNWAVEAERILVNPLAKIGRADERADRRRQPRALTEDEVVRLLDAARRRPLAEALKFNRGWRKGRNGAKVRPDTCAKLERLGWERALAYRVMVLTGLRLGELASIRVCDLDLDAPGPALRLDARHEKNREGSTIMLRADLANELREWVAATPGAPDRMLFRLSPNQVKVFNRDLAFAGIAKRDDRGRTTCIHSLRHTFATLLTLRGVAPRVAQAAMRHSQIDLTMGVYTDPRMLDVAAAMDALPAFNGERVAQA